MDDGQPTKISDAQRFRAMADRIDHNTESTFGGGFVIVPPQQGGEAMEALILDTRADPVQFFMLLQAKIQNVLEDLKDRQRMAGGIRR